MYKIKKDGYSGNYVVCDDVGEVYGIYSSREMALGVMAKLNLVDTEY